MPDELCELWERELGSVFGTGCPNRFEFDVPSPGGPRRFEARVEPEPRPDGAVESVVSVTRDVTEERLAAAELLRITRHRELILSSIGEGVIASDAAGRVTLVNPAAERMLGWTEAELLGRLAHPLVHHTRPDGTPYPADECPSHLALAGEQVACEELFWRRDGTSFPVSYTGTPMWEGDAVVGVTVVLADQSAQRDAETRIALQASLLDQVRNAVIATDLEGRVTYWNRAAETLYGWSEDEALGRPVNELTVPAEGLDAAEEATTAVVESGYWAGELLLRRKDASTFPAEVFDTLVRDDGGAPVAVVEIAADIGERRAAEEALRESEERFRKLAENVDAVFWISDPEATRLDYLSPAYERIWGRPRDEVLESMASFLEHVHPDDRELAAEAVGRTRLGSTEVELRAVKPDGSVAWLRSSGFPIRDESGEVTRIAGLVADVTGRHRLEEQLGQAQKMEAVGRLTGGIAHDFNNLLMAINGYSDGVLSALPEGDSAVRHGLEEIRRAGERAAELTQQLLAFSRRQVLRPEVVDVNSVVGDYAQMLERLLGADVALETRLAGTPGSAKVDPGQLGQVILNLALNAGDAMPQGGRLTIETATARLDGSEPASQLRVPPGDYVVLTVSDTGHGMDERTRAQAFDPFFTTRGIGEGTGLGLSTVLGIVEQSGGGISIYSEPGLGTTVRVYLPRVDERPSRAESPQAVPAPAGKAVLLVEDDDVVRALVEEILGDLGYRVLSAGGAAEAIEIAGRGEEIDLLLTDVVMPEMNGEELARRFADLRPGVRVLFMSGYSGDVIARRGVLAGGSAFLQKPFSAADLARALGELG